MRGLRSTIGSNLGGIWEVWPSRLGGLAKRAGRFGQAGWGLGPSKSEAARESIEGVTRQQPFYILYTSQHNTAVQTSKPRGSSAGGGYERNTSDLWNRRCRFVGLPPGPYPAHSGLLHARRGYRDAAWRVRLPTGNNAGHFSCAGAGSDPLVAIVTPSPLPPAPNGSRGIFMLGGQEERRATARRYTCQNCASAPSNPR